MGSVHLIKSIPAEYSSVESVYGGTIDFMLTVCTLRTAVGLKFKVLVVGNRFEKKKRETLFCPRESIKMVMSTRVVVRWCR